MTKFVKLKLIILTYILTISAILLPGCAAPPAGDSTEDETNSGDGDGTDSDETTSTESLQYRLYYSAFDNIRNPADTEANGTAVGAYSVAAAETADGLSQTTTYYFSVIVRDEAGNRAAYSSVSQGTRISTIEVNNSASADERITSIAAEGPYIYIAVAVDSSYVYAAGTTDDREQYFIDKFNKVTGVKDTDFGTDGRLQFGSNDSYGEEIFGLEAADGYLYALGGESNASACDNLDIFKIDTIDGSFNSYFGGGSDYRTVNPSGYNILWENPLTIDHDSMYIVSEIYNNEAGYNPQWYIEKLSLSSGELDPFFGISGIIYEDLSSETTVFEECAHAVYTDELNVYVGGTMYLDSDNSYEWYLKIYDKITGD